MKNDKADLVEKITKHLAEEYRKGELKTYEEAITFARLEAEELGANFDESPDIALDAWEDFTMSENTFVCDICGEIRSGDDAISLADDSPETEKLSHALDREAENYGADCFTGDRVNTAECICPECKSKFIVLDLQHRLESAIEKGDLAGVFEIEKSDWAELRNRLADGGEVYDEDRFLIDHLFDAWENRK